ncbi:glycoside hydrolase family 37 protein [Hydnum rufescens UP504]|uniref:alpha,alpha-trehalase n=1 Tax=Hydnum rufescens UP504 TaxID=1448309 RepID=A0A9P6ANN8_9AGAM|nr:glycoside hydrolase family 37 protein [Hydnum rufescens UP504]
MLHKLIPCISDPQGLIQSEQYNIVNSTLQNFMDELETIGLVSNAARICHLNRSQPPLFMKARNYSYVAAANDTIILDRAYPLAEGYLPDSIITNSSDMQAPLRAIEKENLYLFYVGVFGFDDKYHSLLADLHDLRASAKTHDNDRHHKGHSDHGYDVHLGTMTTNILPVAALFWPYWNDNVSPEALANETKATQAFSALRMALTRYNGSLPWDTPKYVVAVSHLSLRSEFWIVVPVRYLFFGAWPPHQFVGVEPQQSLAKELTGKALPANLTSFSLILPGLLGPKESQLPLQPPIAGAFATGNSMRYLVVVVVVKAVRWFGMVGMRRREKDEYKRLLGELINRYASGLFYSWFVTGGSIPRLSQ